MLVLAAGCPGAGVPTTTEPDPVRRLTVEVRSYVDTSTVHGIALAPPFAFVASDRGIDRWDLASGARVHFGVKEGLPAARVVAVAVDHARQRLWIGTEAGIMWLAIGGNELSELAQPPDDLGVTKLTGTLGDVRLAAAGDGGVWIGTASGLFHASIDGGWQPSGITDPVTALAVSDDGAVWAGSAGGIAVRTLDGKIARFGTAQGCDAGRIDSIAIAPSGATVAVGSVGGRQRFAIVTGGACAIYRPSSRARVIGVAATKDNFLVATKDGLFAKRARVRGVRRLTRDGFRLLAIAGGASDPLGRLRSVGVSLPAAPTMVAMYGSEVFVGTRDLGTARIALGEPRVSHWLRRRDIAAGAGHLSVACGEDGVCAVAPGNGSLFSLTDGDLSEVDVPGEVLAVVRLEAAGDHPSRLVAIRRHEPDRGLDLLARRTGQWAPIDGVTVDTEGPARVSFAAGAPGGSLWMGLGYATETGYVRHQGVAVVDIDTGEVAYHRRTVDGAAAPRGALDVPLDVVGAAFVGRGVWLATSEGAAHVTGEGVQVYGEAEGLRSEIVHAITRSPRGQVWIATSAGAGKLEGSHWRFPRPLRWPVSDVGADATGHLWLATARGVAVFDGQRVRWLDHRLGLLADRVSQLVVDRFGRVWVLAGDGMTIIAP
ncbi:MAG TPA: hypothetical protein VFG83_12265 [Kofleriaceae bacterium]|nr:hypothetical protein [Kofleriaceae bacterium]